MTRIKLDGGNARRRVVFWIATAIILTESIAGGALDLARKAPYYPELRDLGYPSYFSGILGTAKLLAAATLLAPRLPRLKEWAYAGIVFALAGAAISQAAAGHGVGDVAPPAVFTAIALVSWATAPSLSRTTPHCGASREHPHRVAVDAPDPTSEPARR